jgi:hypothetical protein
LALSLAALPTHFDARSENLRIPRGGPVQTDGVIALSEWQKAS